MRNQVPAFASYRAFCEETYGPFVQRMEALPGATLVMSEQPAGDGSVCATPDLVFGRIAHGRGRYHANLGNGRFDGRLDRSDVLLLAPHSHNPIMSSARHGVELLALRYGLLQQRLGADLALPEDGVFDRAHDGPLANPVYARLLAGLFAIDRYDDSAAQMFLDGTVTSLMALLSRERGRGAGPAWHKGGLAGWQLRRVREALAAVETQASLVDLAAAVNLSPFHFARAFKQSTGQPPHRYLILLRVERAKELLATSQLPLAEVAAAVGYQDQSYFARVFRREVGCLPSRYRREQQQ